MQMLNTGCSTLLLLPLLGALLIMTIPSSRIQLTRILGFSISLFTFLYSLTFWIRFDKSTPQFQFVETINWLPHYSIQLVMGLDGISLFLLF